MKKVKEETKAKKMKKIQGNNNIALVKALNGEFLPEFELDDKTSLITSSDDVNIFNTQEELQTFIASQAVINFPPIPNIGELCEKNKIYAYGTDKVKCLQEHNRMNYTPEETPALWLIIPTVEDYPVWVQPTGGHDAYQTGDRVYFPTANDSVYESLIDANVWSPTVYPQGWKLI